MIRLFLTIGLATFSAGCTTTGMFKNEMSVVPGTGQLLFHSFYGPLAVTAKIDGPAPIASAPTLTLTPAKGTTK